MHWLAGGSIEFAAEARAAHRNGDQIMTRRILAICLDSGDTLVDEGTEIKDEHEVTQRAELIPGAAQLVQELKRRGYPLALVADGPVGTFRNVLGHHGLYPLFDALAISGEVGVEKPQPAIFHHALQQLGIAPSDYDRVIMVGNNLERDTKGANQLGLISVWLDWAPRRSKIPADQTEAPHFTLKQPLDLLAILDELERLPHPRPLTDVTGRPTPAWPRRWGSQRIQTVCHKGANEYAPENTYAAAQLCLDWGMDYVEIDVNRSRDGVYYLLHGPQVDQTTNGSGRLTELTAAQIDQLDAGSWFGPQFAGEPVPRLEPFLRWIKGKAKLFLDVKAGEPAEISALIHRLGLERECFFWSGSDAWAAQLRALAPDLQLKINVKDVAGVVAAHEQFRANIVEVSLADMSPALVAACRERGIQVMVYVTERDPAAYRAVLAWDADLINLNHGDLFAQIANQGE